MLALGAFRSAFHARLRPLRFTSILNNPHRHFLSISHNSLARPYTWRTGLWYRRDGTPRSKREGAIYVALALLMWFPYHLAVDLYRESELIFYLIHIRRINSYYQYDLSQPGDLIEYFFKLIRLDFIPGGKKNKKFAKDVCMYILEASPEACTYIRSQLEELRNLSKNDDVNEDTLETARAAWGVLERVVNVFKERLDHNSSIQYIKEERQESDAKDLYHGIG